MSNIVSPVPKSCYGIQAKIFYWFVYAIRGRCRFSRCRRGPWRCFRENRDFIKCYVCKVCVCECSVLNPRKLFPNHYYAGLYCRERLFPLFVLVAFESAKVSPHYSCVTLANTKISKLDVPTVKYVAKTKWKKLWLQNLLKIRVLRLIKICDSISLAITNNKPIVDIHGSAPAAAAAA